MDDKENVPLLSSQESTPKYASHRISPVVCTTDLEKGLEDSPVHGDQAEQRDDWRENSMYESVPGTHPKRIARLLSTAGEPMEAITLTWRNLCVQVETEDDRFCRWLRSRQIKRENKHILKNVNGVVRPGTLLALIGASGAGKSTLLNVLTHRNLGKMHVTGDVRVNGIEAGRNIRNISGYVQQDDMFFGTLTVREHLIFRALLRMDKRIKKAGRLQRVEEVIHELGLEKCSDTIIGTPGQLKGISGGEKKRLSFASEILTNPPLLFCDEATSGLDSFMAQSLVHALKDLVLKGRTILCTIHQPSSEVFAMFDQLLLMAEGRVAYMGSTEGALRFFDSQGYQCPSNFNPADYYVSTLAMIPDNVAECQKKVDAICDAFKESDISREMEVDHDKIRSKNSKNVLKGPLFEELFSHESRYESSWCRQLVTVVWRTWLHGLREPMVIKVRAIQTIFIALLLGLIYLQQDYDQEGVMNINGSLFIFLNFVTFNSMFATINVFPLELPIFLREHGSGIYRVDVYFLSKTLCDIPTYILLPFAYTSIVYWMIGLYNNVMNFLIAAGILILVANTAVSLGYLISTIASSMGVAMAMAPPVIIPLMLFGGFFLNSGTVPDYFIWLEYLSWFKYANELLVINQWGDVDYIACTPPGGSGNKTLPSNATDGRCFNSGDDVIEFLHFDRDNVYLDVGLTVALLVGFRLVSFFFLLVRAKRSSA